MANRSWLTLAMTEGIGPILARRLIERAGGIDAAVEAGANLLRTVEGIGQAKAPKIAASLNEARSNVDDELNRAQALGIRVICPEDESYPHLLRTIPDPPLVLYVKGTLEPRDLNSIAIVGSRKCTFYGREQAERFGASLAGAGFTVISGGARGVDSSAHRGAMSNPNGRTIAVLGCGLDKVYPPENASLFDQIAQHGAVMSEYPLGTPPIAENFPRRNRIVSGMSRGVLVIEADERSGALITARQAIDDHGRTVFAVPGKIDSPQSAGPHELIRQGAVLTANVQDILRGLGSLDDSIPQPTSPTLFDAPAMPTAAAPVKAASSALLSEVQEKIIQAADEPCDVDTLTERTGLSTQEILQQLTFLSLKGHLKRVDGQRYVASK